MVSSIRKVFSVVLSLMGLSASLCWAELNVEVTQGRMAAIPIAIPVFEGGGQHQKIAQSIKDVIVADLTGTGLFRLVNPAAYLKNQKDSIRFSDWRVIQAQALVQGQVREASGGQVRVDFRLYDVYTEKQIEGLSYTISSRDWRRAAHKIADAVYKRLTGESGYFDSRIVYVAQGPAPGRKTRLAIMDQDGANHVYLTDGKSLVMTPRFSPNLQDITYLDFGHRDPKVYLIKLAQKARYLVGNFPGMTFAPRFNPTGQEVILSMAREGTSSIYVQNLASGMVRPLTSQEVHIDTSPSYSPDGKRVVFNSDRDGRQQLYVMDADGSQVRRISYGQGSYATPVWSPRGDYIAFTRMYRGTFYIGVMRADGTGERLLASGFLVESPTWAPNGRVLMYTRAERSGRNGKGGASRLYTIDITGHNERQIRTPEGALSPAWSSLMP